MTIPPEFLEELRNRVPVSDVARRHMQLRKQGREWAGLSPFNKEKTPSFFVNDDKRFYHCFSSGKHGDVFSFLTEVTGLSFREAVETVADMAGMEVPSEGAGAVERRQAVRSVQDTLALATAYFEQQLRLPVGRQPLDYLRQRGLDDATIRRFRLGYAPAMAGSTAAGLASDGIGQAQLIDAGLVKRRDDGSCTDYFRDRFMFPISDRQGRVIAFGGRTLGDGQPKYLNSPETAAFHKSRVLYGLAQAREAAHKNGRLLVVEGYMDVIALSQAGIADVVAPLGTSLGEDQIRLLWSLAAEPVLCLDGDRAGRAAAIRAAERALPILQPGRSLAFALLPAGEDPDSLVRTAGTEAMVELVAAAEPLADMLWRAEWERHVPSSPERQAAFHRAVLEQVKRIQEPTVRTYYEQAMRERLRNTFAPHRNTPQQRARQGSAYGQDAAAWRQPLRPTGRFRHGGEAMPLVPSVHRRADPRRLNQQRQRTLLGLLSLYPELVEELGERVLRLEFADRALDRGRDQILSLTIASNELDATPSAAQVTTGTNNQSTEEAEVVVRLLQSALESARAVVGSDETDAQEARMKAKFAAVGLIEALEQDAVRADLASRLSDLEQGADQLERFESSVAFEAKIAAERFRTPT